MDFLDGVVVTDIISTVTVSSEQGRKEVIKDRASYGLSFCIDGQITYTHNGIDYVSNKGNAIFLPKGETYKLFCSKKGVFPVINFDTLVPLCATHMVIPIKDNSYFVSAYELLRKNLSSSSEKLKAMSVFYEILHKLVFNKNDYGVITPAISFINSNFASQDISNSMIAEQCNISEVYFRKLFIEKMKITPRQYIIDLRINKAKELLRDGVMRIGDISDSCGFTNPYHFIRVFKERVGITPGEYMKNNRVYKI